MTSIPDVNTVPTSTDPEGFPEVEMLRRQLIDERERSLNAVDARRGAEAVAAQAQAEVRELGYLLHVREAELQQLQEVVDGAGLGRIPESGDAYGELENQVRSIASALSQIWAELRRRLDERRSPGARR